MTKKSKRKTRQRYTAEFKCQAIELAKEIGIQPAAEKLGLQSWQSLGAWVRDDKKAIENRELVEIDRLKAENRRLKKELEAERTSVSILKKAAAFFSQDQLK